MLREYALPGSRRFHDIYDSLFSAYYNGSEIDLWLNNDFIATIKYVDILDSTINISTKEALGRCGEETEDIVRKAFFLSFGEVGGREAPVIPANGNPLDYFLDKPNRRIAYCEDESVPCAWWLRSSDTWNRHTPFAINSKGAMGGASCEYGLGVRPAFCLDSGTEIVLHEESALDAFFIIKNNEDSSYSSTESFTIYVDCRWIYVE